MTYLVRVESKRRIDGVTLAANIPVDAEHEEKAKETALRFFANFNSLPFNAVKVTKTTLEVA